MTTRELVIVRGDTVAIRATLRDAYGVKNISGATVLLILKGQLGGYYALTCTLISTGTDGRVQHIFDWGTPAVAPVADRYSAEMRVTYGDSSIQTFPNRRPNTVVVREQLSA